MTARVDAVLATAGEPEWDITTADAIGFGTFEATPAAISVGFRRPNA